MPRQQNPFQARLDMAWQVGCTVHEQAVGPDFTVGPDFVANSEVLFSFCSEIV
jgi:hypothetical protein